MGGLVKICLLLTAAFFVIGSAVIGSARLTARGLLASDPAVVPQQPTSALKNYSCLLRFSETNNSASAFCEFTSEQGSSEDIPIKTVVVQSDNLRLGDLFLCLGVPTNIQHLSFVHGENLINLLWSDPDSAVWSDLNGAHLDYFLPISYLSIEGKGSLCRST